MKRSIRWRLTVWNAVGVAVVLVGFAALVYWLAGRALRQQADRTAEAAFRLVETDPRMATNPSVRAKYWVREFDEHMGVLAAIYEPDGTPLAAHPGVTSRGLSGASPVRRLETDPDGHRWRLAVEVVRASDQEVHVLLMVPLRHQEADLAALGRAMLLAIPVGLVATAGLAYLLARGAVAPVDQLRQTMERITADRLHERLPVHNPNDELGQLAGTVNTMIGRLERSFAEIKRFTADASHELRTPLTAIRTVAEVALAGDPTREELRDIIESVLEECGRMARLTDQLLTLARDDAGVVPRPLERLSITSLVRDVVDTLRPLADAKGVSITFEESQSFGTVAGDPVRLRQVVVNLIDNAIKYTPPGGSVRVGTVEVDGNVRLTVADTGEGIPAEHLPRVFDRFYRVDKARSREQGGTGLGLSIVQSIATAHAGGVSITSGEGVGTTATVTLPLNRAVEPA